MTGQPGCDRFHPAWPRGVWPDASQELLIKACLLDDADAARAAFRDWSRADDLFFVDNGLNLFLMLLYERLKSWKEFYRDHDRLRGVVRHAWVMHQRFRRDIREIGGTLSSGGIDVMLLKGAALNITAYPDASVRSAFPSSAPLCNATCHERSATARHDPDRQAGDLQPSPVGMGVGHRRAAPGAFRCGHPVRRLP